MADASIGRLLDALAAKLPPKATRKTVEVAFRAAIDAVPKSKLRDKLLLKEGRWIRDILRRLAERVETEVQDDEAVAEPKKTNCPDCGNAYLDDSLFCRKCGRKRDEEATPPEDEGAEGLVLAAGAAYRGMDGSSAMDCLRRCHELLREALVSVSPCARGAEAVQGLVALVPPETKGPSWQLDMDALELIIRMLPIAATALGVVGQRDTPAAWKRFLGLALSAPLHAKVPASKEDLVKEASARLGGVLALLACPAGARAALRIAIARCCAPPSSVKQLARLAPAALPLFTRAAEGGLGGDSQPSRGDLLALLSSLHFLHQAGRHGLAAGARSSEARESLGIALGRGFDATPLLPELRRLAEDLSTGSLPKRSRPLLKKVDACIAEGRASASSAMLLECLQAFSEALQPQHLQRLSGFSGLPVGEDENTDLPAAAARARGDLFFEDTAGDVPLESLLVGGGVAAAEAAAHARKRTLGDVEGVEDLRGAGNGGDEDGADEEAASAPDLDPALPAFDEDPIASPEGDESQEPTKSGTKRVRRRSKGAA